MSQFLTILNQLKAESRLEWLTDNQQAVWQSALDRLRFPDRVNLYGAAGTGKTFVAWALANERNATFFASPAALTQSNYMNMQANLVVVDNGTNEPNQLRRILAELQMRNGRSALIITRFPNQIGLPLLHLPLPTAQDISIVYRNLSLLEKYALSPHSEGNLWQIIHSTLS